MYALIINRLVLKMRRLFHQIVLPYARFINLTLTSRITGISRKRRLNFCQASLLGLIASIAILAEAQPAAPNGLSATPGDAEATLRWQNPSNSAITGYSVRYATDNGAFSGSNPPDWAAISGSEAATVSHTVDGLTNGTRYYFQLRATSAAGDGPAANTTIQLAAAPAQIVTLSAPLKTAVLRKLNKDAGADLTQLDMARLVDFRASRSGISDLAGLEHAVNLEILVLQYNTVSDLSALAPLTQLKILDLWGNGRIADVTALRGATLLWYLDLDDNSVADVTPLGSLTSLRRLFLSRNSVTSVAPLESLTALEQLGLTGNSVSDVTALGSLTSLQRLFLSKNQITSIAALSSLTALRRLELADNSISDVTPLGSLTSLNALSLSNNSIANVKPLESLTSLTWLPLDGNQISDVAPLNPLVALNFLDLDRNSISNVGPLTSLQALRRLDLNSNQISDVTALGELLPLTALHLGNNQISDVAPLESLTSLTSISLQYNQIEDVTPLGELTSLTFLNLWDNSISDVTALGSLTSLTRLYLSYNSVASVDALESLTELEVLLLTDNNVEDVTALGSLTSLVHLNLTDNSISNVQPLGSLTSLRILELLSNSISVVPAGSIPASVAVLRLRSNSIEDIAGLANIESPRYIDLRDNSVADIGVLAELTYAPLEAADRVYHNGALFVGKPLVDLRENPLGAASLENHVPALRNKSVTVLIDDSPASRGPAKPAELVATPGDGRATLRWRNPSNDAITGYAVRRATNASAFTGATPPDWMDISGSGAETVEHVVEELTNGTRYHFQLRATSASGVGAAANATVRLAASPASEVTFAAALRAAVAKAAGKGSGESLTQLDVARVRELRAASSEIADLTGLERAVNLVSLDLTDNSISGLAALSNLDELRILRLGGNGLDDISALSRLTSLEELWLNDNRVSNLRPLTGLTSLDQLEVARNEVRDLPALNGMTALSRLRLDGNRVANVSALVQSGLGEGSVVGLRGNPLSTASIEQHLPSLRAAGVAVLAGKPVPLFPSASDEERQGFVRVTNRSDEAGEVLIHAVDDAGTRFDPVRLSIGAGESAHFNSDDLEQGNAAKGLSGGVGAPTRGHWRLALLSTLDIEVLAYLRTPDGFLTSVHDMLRRDDGTGTLAAPIFNPGSNARQRSSLRLINPGGVGEPVAVLGVDDRGSGGDHAVGLVVPAGGATTVTAVTLEAGPGNESGLGDGAGKWRLVVNARWPVEAASLLTSPTGHVTNLSAHAAADANGVWRLPFYPASANASGWQGFARVINRGSRAGEATIVAVDDSGMRTDSVTLALNGGQTVHFNSDDLERGNAAKGLPTGVGAPARGDWRLELTSALDVSVTSYIRTSDGFLTSMHDAAPTASTDDGERRVVIFNPGSNQRQVSLLRLINDGDAEAAVTVTGIDDAGRPGGEARATVPAGEALTLTAQELESGADTFEGALGDGQGKWRLTVASDAPVSVVSLLRSPTGHLTNLSRTPRRFD